MECRKIISELYEHPEVLKLIAKLDPPELREDLRQEFAIILLDYPCEKLQEAQKSGKIVYLAIRILMNMATGVNGNFYRTYRLNRTYEDYQPDGNRGVDIDYRPLAKIAKDILNQKLLMDANEAHEAIIFEKFVELGSRKKVAEYYGIPYMHVFQVVNNTRNELKKKIKKRL